MGHGFRSDPDCRSSPSRTGRSTRADRSRSSLVSKITVEDERAEEGQDRRSKRRTARHPAATPVANITPTIHTEAKLIFLGSRRRSSRLRFGIWDSGPSHSSSDERFEPFLKRMVVFPSLMIPLIPHKLIHTKPNPTTGVTTPRQYEN